MLTRQTNTYTPLAVAVIGATFFEFKRRKGPVQKRKAKKESI